MMKKKAKKRVTKKRAVHTVRVVPWGVDQFSWNETAANGQITAPAGEGYTRREDAVRAAKDHCDAKRVFVEDK